MNKKYELLKDNYITLYNGTKLYRISSLKDFSDVKKGDIGGFIESEDNLSQEGNCWVYNDAIVMDNAEVYNNARIYGNVYITGNAKVYGVAVIRGNSRIFGNMEIFE